MLHKSFEALDTKVDADAGTFEATVAIFGNVDKGGDRILPGAFAKTLAAWKASGDPIPVIFNHDWASPDAHIGVVEDAAETTKGLYVKGRLDVADNPVAKQVHRLMARRSLREFSFGYSVPKGGEKRARDGANDLSEIDLAEVGPTLKGMNPATELHAVKSALGVGPTPEELRSDSERLAREVEEAAIPEIKATPAEPVVEQPDPIAEQLQDVLKRLSTVESQFEDMKKKAEETGKAPEARSVDPLRRRSDELALELSSVGLDLRQPPTQAKTAPEPDVDLAELRRQSHDLMLQVLSTTTGVTDEPV